MNAKVLIFMIKFTKQEYKMLMETCLPQMRHLSAEKRKEVGPIINKVKKAIDEMNREELIGEIWDNDGGTLNLEQTSKLIDLNQSFPEEAPKPTHTDLDVLINDVRAYVALIDGEVEVYSSDKPQWLMLGWVCSSANGDVYKEFSIKIRDIKASIVKMSKEKAEVMSKCFITHESKMKFAQMLANK